MIFIIALLFHLLFAPSNCKTIANEQVEIQSTNSHCCQITINFGSCVVPEYDQPLWNDIVTRDPDLFIFTGDATYLDYQNADTFFNDTFGMWKFTILYPFSKYLNISNIFGINIGPNNPKIPDPSTYADTWSKTYANIPYFDKLVSESNTQIIGIYDDHDFGYDDADGFNPHKQLTRQLFIDFFNLTEKIANIPKQGLYYHYPLEIELKWNDNDNDKDSSFIKNKIIDIIVLDIHYFSGLEREDDLLGSEQWKWFENIMNVDNYITTHKSIMKDNHNNSKNKNKQNSNISPLKGDYVIIVSGEQLLPYHKKFYLSNIWSTRKYSFQRLWKNIIIPWKTHSETKDKLVFITGDVHYGEINDVFCVNSNHMRENIDSINIANFDNVNSKKYSNNFFIYKKLVQVQ